MAILVGPSWTAVRSVGAEATKENEDMGEWGDSECIKENGG